MPRERRSRGFGLACLPNGALLIVVFIIELFIPQEAFALPSFARQTGLGCGACHTEFPQLTPFGRRFKILGYTLGRSVPEDKRVLGNNPPLPTKDQWPSDPTVPLSAQVIATLTHTATGQDTAGSAPYLKSNDNVELQTASLFYGGRHHRSYRRLCPRHL